MRGGAAVSSSGP